MYTVSDKKDSDGRTDFMMRSDEVYNYGVKCSTIGKPLENGDTIQFQQALNGKLYARNLSNGAYSTHVVKKVTKDSILTQDNQSYVKPTVSTAELKRNDTILVRDWDRRITNVRPYTKKRNGHSR